MAKIECICGAKFYDPDWFADHWLECGSSRSPGGCAARSAGQIDYEADVEECPTYDDGTPRKQWHELSDVAQWSWERRAK